MPHLDSQMISDANRQWTCRVTVYSFLRVKLIAGLVEIQQSTSSMTKEAQAQAMVVLSWSSSSRVQETVRHILSRPQDQFIFACHINQLK